MTEPVDLRPDHAKIVHDILRAHLPAGVSVSVFGSRAKWTAKSYSDLDLALKGDVEIPLPVLAELADAFDESDLPFRVDLVDWHSVTPSFQAVIEKDGMQIYSQEKADRPLRTIGDYVTLQRGTTYKSSLLGRPGPVLLGLGSIAKNGGFNSANLKTYGGESDPRLLLSPGDVYVSLKDVTQSADLLGAVAKVPAGITVGRLTQDTVKLVFRKDDAPRDYIYWLLQTPQYRAYCRAHATGTTNLGLAREDFFAFPVPTLSQSRQELVSLLSAAESRIELNRRMNETLEAMARAIFKDWFVDFGPTRAKMEGRAPYLTFDIWALFPDRLDDEDKPEGWNAGTLNDLAQASGSTVAPGSIDPTTPYIGLEHMPRRSIALAEWEGAGKVSSGKLSFQKGNTLFGKLRPYFHKVGIAAVDGICSTDIVVVRARRSFASAFVTAIVSSDEFVDFTDRTSGGTKMPRTSWGMMASFPITVPHENSLIAFEELVAPMFERICTNIHESRALAATRDLLLPKLMSGEIRVRDAEAIVADAA